MFTYLTSQDRAEVAGVRAELSECAGRCDALSRQVDSLVTVHDQENQKNIKLDADLEDCKLDKIVVPGF